MWGDVLHEVSNSASKRKILFVFSTGILRRISKVQNEQGLCVLFFGEEVWVTNASVSRHFGTFPESIPGNDDVWKW